jgi:hypothetical protein
MDLIITLEDFGQNRILSQNIDYEAIAPYINEAQDLDLSPLLGEALYYDFISKVLNKNDSKYLDYQTLLNGGTYVKENTNILFKGVKPFLVYMAYSRLILEHQVKVTRFGVNTKDGNQSIPTEFGRIKLMSNEARDKAVAYGTAVSNFLEASKETYPLFEGDKCTINNIGVRFITVNNI